MTRSLMMTPREAECSTHYADRCVFGNHVSQARVDNTTRAMRGFDIPILNAT